MVKSNWTFKSVTSHLPLITHKKCESRNKNALAKQERYYQSKCQNTISLLNKNRNQFLITTDVMFFYQ